MEALPAKRMASGSSPERGVSIFYRAVNRKTVVESTPDHTVAAAVFGFVKRLVGTPHHLPETLVVGA